MASIRDVTGHASQFMNNPDCAALTCCNVHYLPSHNRASVLISRAQLQSSQHQRQSAQRPRELEDVRVKMCLIDALP